MESVEGQCRSSQMNAGDEMSKFGEELQCRPVAVVWRQSHNLRQS